MASSEGNKINDETSFQSSEPSLCANGCGFFGAAATMGFCSKCYRYLQIEKEQATSAKIAMQKIVRPQIDAVDVASSSLLTAPAEKKAVKEESPEAAAEDSEKKVVRNRCLSCNKKVGLMGFDCRCGSLFCGVHRYPEKHACTFDFKIQGKEAIAKANPVVKADKIQRI